MSRQRSERYFPHQGRQLRRIAKTIRDFGLRNCTAARAVERIRQIADEIDSQAEILKPPRDEEGG